MFDIRIINGTVCDGTGSAPVRKDVGITGNLITAIENLSSAQARTTLDASGQIVCPGFIDAHSHSDTYLLIEPSAHSKIFQGITTEVIGNCGASGAPLEGAYQLPSDWAEKKYPGRWRSVADYRNLLKKVKPAVNVFMLIGHKTIRVAVAGYENRRVTADEISSMRKLLEKALDEGARGLSSGLIYAPATSATPEELSALAEVASRRNGIYTSHMRSEGSELISAIEETISVGRQTGIRVEISHLKTSGRKNWHLINKALETVRKAIKDGTNVCADRYPYTSSCTDLDILLPNWATYGGREKIMTRLADSGERAKIKNDMTKTRPDDYWQSVTVGSTSHPDNSKYKGVPIADVATDLKIHPADAVLYLIEKDGLNTSAFFSGMSEDNLMRILKEPYVMIGTDASLRTPSGPLSHDHPHPRAYGAFPTFFRMAMDRKLMSLEEAVRKMTGLPAKHFGISDRGVIARNMKADVVVIDPDRFDSKSTYADPHRLAEGVSCVIVNGTVTVDGNGLTGNRSGEFLA